MEEAHQEVSQQPSVQWAMRKRNEAAGAEGVTEKAAHVSGVLVCTQWLASVESTAHASGA